MLGHIGGANESNKYKTSQHFESKIFIYFYYHLNTSINHFGFITFSLFYYSITSCQHNFIVFLIFAFAIFSSVPLCAVHIHIQYTLIIIFCCLFFIHIPMSIHDISIFHHRFLVESKAQIES